MCLDTFLFLDVDAFVLWSEHSKKMMYDMWKASDCFYVISVQERGPDFLEHINPRRNYSRLQDSGATVKLRKTGQVPRGFSDVFEVDLSVWYMAGVNWIVNSTSTALGTVSTPYRLSIDHRIPNANASAAIKLASLRRGVLLEFDCCGSGWQIEWKR